MPVDRVALGHERVRRKSRAEAMIARDTLARHELHATGTTGSQLAVELELHVHRFLSGPLGGDQQIGAGDSRGPHRHRGFFWDPLEPR